MPFGLGGVIVFPKVIGLVLREDEYNKKMKLAFPNYEEVGAAKQVKILSVN